MEKSILSKAKLLGVAVGTTITLSQAQAFENPMYQCLDAVELSERFEIHSNQATYMMDQFKVTTFEGKKMTWSEIEDELRKSGYTDGVIHANPSAEEKAELEAKKAKALKDPRIAKLANKYETEYRSKEHFDQRVKEQDALLSKTYSFHKNRGGARLLQGIQDSDQREDKLSPVRPYGLMATRTKPDGQYLYILTKEGPRRIKVSDKPETGGNRFVVALKRLGDPEPSDKKGFPKVDIVKLNGSDVTPNWPSDTELKAAGVDPFSLYDDPAAYAKKLGKKLTVIDLAKLPLDEEISADAKAVFKEEFAKIIGKVVSSHDNQMSYLKKIDDAQKNRIKKDWNFDERRLSEIYTERYTTALKKCADLTIGVTNDALAAIDKIGANQQQYFGSKQPTVQQAAPVKAVQ